MSAYLCENAHLCFLISADLFLRWEPPPNMIVPDFKAKDLQRENLASLKARYGETDPTEPPEYTEAVYKKVRQYFLDPRRSNAEKVAQVFMAIDCYEYQSCEHEEWDESKARRFCDDLRKAWARELPGYDAAAWRIPDLPALYPPSLRVGKGKLWRALSSFFKTILSRAFSV